MRSDQQRVISTVRKEKYAAQCLELILYWKKHITQEQLESVNLDDHTAYLVAIRQDKSQYLLAM